MKQNYAILVFSHLRWNFVYQRPQQLLTRLASDHRVIFIEERAWIALMALNIANGLSI